MRKVIATLFVVGVLFFVISLARQSLGDGGSASERSPDRQESIVVFPNEVIVTVDIADNRREREKGLGGRESLSDSEGLLFLHDESVIQSYWMKGMLIPIDIIWIDGERVIGFVEDAQPEDPPITIYTSPAPVDKVLEVSAGFVDRNGLEIGDILDIQLSGE
jgi:uncharacterized protein